MAAAFDANWGAASYCVSALVARRSTLEQQAADGTTDSRAWIAEAKRELRAMVNDGLFILEEVRMSGASHTGRSGFRRGATSGRSDLSR